MQLGFEDLRERVRACAQSDRQLLRVEVGDVRLAIARSDAALPYRFGAPGVAEICFADAAMAEYGQALMRIRPS